MSGTPSPAAAADTRFVAERLLTVVREDIGRADTKAAILLSGSVAVLAVGLPKLWPGTPDTAAGAVLLAAGAALCAAGMLMLVCVILPRTRIGADRTFLRDFARGAPVEELLDRLAVSGADVVAWLMSQASVHGAVLAAKYRWLRWGVGFLSAGTTLALLGEWW